jgi:hypothetical protein
LKLPIFKKKVKTILNINYDPENFPYFYAATKGYSRIKEKSIEECRKNSTLSDFDAMRTIIDMVRGQILYTDLSKLKADIEKIIKDG